MRSADEATLVDAMHGTSLNARATACAKVVVDGGEVILNGDCAVGTGLLALHTADTAVLTVLTYVSALIMVGAFNDNAYGIVEKVDNAVGTLTNADATADTLLGINACYAVLDSDSVLRADSRAVTVSKTGEGAELVATVRHISGKTGLNALIFVLLLIDAAGTVAGYESNLFYNVLCLNSEDGSDLLCGSVTAGNTEIGLVGGLFRKSLSVSVASGVTASATVSAGETVTDCNGSLVLLYAEEYRRKGKENCAYDSDTYEDKNRNKYSHFLPPYASRFSTTPANPKNARATMEAAMSVIGTPRKHLGEGQFSILERTPAKSTIARRKPRPTPSEEIID